MSIVAPDENGIIDCHCNGDHFLLVHDNVKVVAKIVHNGVTSTGAHSYVMEYFDTEQEREDRITELGLEV